MYPSKRHACLAIGLLVLLVGRALAQEPPAPPAPAPAAAAVPPPLAVPRLAGEIAVDGKLDEPAWQSAAVIDAFFETFPADNAEPAVKTVAYLAYDDSYFYIGVHAFDPEPQKIRAPYVERDKVLGTDDNVAVFLDTRNDRRSAIELRVNPRGNQGDASYNDANGSEDFSPDFFYDTAAQLTDDGWTAEMRIPFSSLRYPKLEENRWGILVWRNYPRDQRYMIHSSPIPRGSNCWICQSRELTGLRGLPSGGNLVMAPYVTGQQSRTPTGELGSPLGSDDPEADAGIDVKWTPSASNALDLTLNPDFSQIESDVGQIGVNNQFALFFPEKRPFFLEGVDLFDSPFQAVYTRTITDPRWGVRDTGKLGNLTYTLLVTEDEGGGRVVIPGPTGSGRADQDFSSHVLVGRLRRDFGASFAGLLVTDREIDGGGFNRVIGPDLLWRRSETDQVTAQVLYSDTETPERPDLFRLWDGRKLTGHAAHLEWLHTGERWTWRATARDVDEDFRNDQGFETQVGYRRGRAFLGYSFYPKGLLRRVQTYAVTRHDDGEDGDLLSATNVFGFGAQGSKNLTLTVELIPGDRQRIGSQVLERDWSFIFFQIDPGRRFSRIGLEAQIGEAFDFTHARVGDGNTFVVFGTIKPTDRLAIEPMYIRQWLDVDAATRSGTLFDAEIQRVKATYNFSSRMFLRVIGEYSKTDFEPALWAFPVPSEDQSFNGSALFAYQINWQTVLYVGYGDDRAQDVRGRLEPAAQTAFVKISYAFQR
jgi:hypothetical protein